MIWHVVFWLLMIFLLGRVIFSILLLPSIGFSMSWAFLREKQSSWRHATVPLVILGQIWTAYIVVSWGAYCAYTSRNWMASPSVEHEWVYGLIGGLTCSGVLASMIDQDDRAGFNPGCLFTLLALGSFLVYLFYWEKFVGIVWWWMKYPLWEWR